MSILVPALLLLTALAGAAVVFSREPRRMVFAMAANGLVLALLFMVLQAPDVAFSELTVGAAAVPLLFLVVIGRVRTDQKPADDPPP